MLTIDTPLSNRKWCFPNLYLATILLPLPLLSLTLSVIPTLPYPRFLFFIRFSTRFDDETQMNFPSLFRRFCIFGREKSRIEIAN